MIVLNLHNKISLSFLVAEKRQKSRHPPPNVQLEVLHFILTLCHPFLFILRDVIMVSLRLTYANFRAKTKTMSYFGIFKFSMLAPYKRCEKQNRKYGFVLSHGLPSQPDNHTF